MKTMRQISLIPVPQRASYTQRPEFEQEFRVRDCVEGFSKVNKDNICWGAVVQRFEDLRVEVK